MSSLIAIDPGPVESAYVRLDPEGALQEFAILPNEAMESSIFRQCTLYCVAGRLVIEKIESYGMAVGASVFETVYWSGRFAALWDQKANNAAERLGRKAVKLHLCGQNKAKDSNIRQALIDRYGGVGGKQAAVGTKAAPGPLYGVKKDVWAALALGVTALDMNERSQD